MIRALNYTPKAIESLRSHPCPGAPGVRQGMDYLIRKLEQAEVFVLPDNGQLMDRAKPRADLPGMALKPPFEVVALEYSALNGVPCGGEYNAETASRRISLAWEWRDDLPPLLAAIAPPIDEPGVVIASITYFDRQNLWMPIAGAAFVPFDGGPAPADAVNLDFVKAMVADRRVTRKSAETGMSLGFIPIMPEAVMAGAQRQGIDKVLNDISADVMDEVCAYIDLCHVLLCKNVRAERQPASAALNRARNKSRPPLRDFHILTIDGHGEGEGSGEAFSGPRNGPRSHLRRGHIRRLDASRVTWVNATMVRGRGGFVDKAYSVGARS
ncbi:hypothetical protein [Sphingobium chungbukense]|uniref:Uncharacterized protein n=1 Tax=Sphingobium chungbukense TaxID=56193 RepID=A0A0M3AQ13_9SPHN|nr:hypothetical protein [Sphingobium chungbukense]KKW92272.1 hypothetical protein YP76_10095 [Sphingobium chungbukense]